MARPAAPAPLITILSSPIFLPVTFTAFSRPAAVTMAVPCWSSWNTGMSHSSFRRSSTSKHCGAAMSSRLMPPKLLLMSCTVRTSSSVSCVSTQMGKASTSPNSLKSRHLPSITGMPAAAPMSPRPRTAVLLVMTATRCERRVSSQDLL